MSRMVPEEVVGLWNRFGR